MFCFLFPVIKGDSQKNTHAWTSPILSQVQRIWFRYPLFWTQCLCSPSPKFICYSPNTQCDSVRNWGLWEGIRFRRDLYPYKKKRKTRASSLCHLRTWQEGGCLHAGERAFPKHRICWQTHLRLPGFQNCKKSMSAV